MISTITELLAYIYQNSGLFAASLGLFGFIGAFISGFIFLGLLINYFWEEIKFVISIIIGITIYLLKLIFNFIAYVIKVLFLRIRYRIAVASEDAPYNSTWIDRDKYEKSRTKRTWYLNLILILILSVNMRF